MHKKLIAFDLDGTLAPSKSPVPDQIVEMLQDLLVRYKVCIISGGDWPQFEKQVLSRLSTAFLHNLHLMPTCGTKYFKFDVLKQEWVRMYSEDLTEHEVRYATMAINAAIEGSPVGMFPNKIWGPQVENRGTQITFSALGQQAPVEEKERWDSDGSKKSILRKVIASFLPELEVRAGGSTSIDITKKGIDKAYGMGRLLDILNLSIYDAVFFGDKLQEGGNDYPVAAMGVECFEVVNWKETYLLVKAYL